MIRNHDVYANPYRGTQQDGIRRFDQHTAMDDFDDGLNAARGLINAAILGMCVWLLVAIPVLLWMGWL